MQCRRFIIFKINFKRRQVTKIFSEMASDLEKHRIVHNRAVAERGYKESSKLVACVFFSYQLTQIGDKSSIQNGTVAKKMFLVYG